MIYRDRPDNNMISTARVFLGLGAITSLLGVALGAYAAHALATTVTPAQAALFQTALQYHLFHALGLLAVGCIAALRPSPLLTWAGTLMVAGIALFCGTLYLSAVGVNHGLRVAAPAGGFAFMAAWLLVAVAMLRR